MERILLGLQEQVKPSHVKIWQNLSEGIVLFSTVRIKLQLSWCKNYLQVLHTQVLGHVLINLTELISKFYLLLLSKYLLSDKLYYREKMFDNLNLVEKESILIMIWESLSQWILDMQVERNYLIISRLYSDQSLWWFQTTLWLLKLCCFQRDFHQLNS